MTQITVRGDLVQGVLAACALAGIRPPSRASWTTGTLVPQTSVVEWLPDLSTNDLATVNTIVKLAVGASLLTPAERTALEPRLASGRTWLALNQSTFRGLTENAMRDQVLDSVSALWRVIFMLLRDS